MFQSFLKVAWRNLLRNKAYSFVNIGGLALGMTVVLLISLIAFLVATPLATWFMNGWLAKYQYRTELSLRLFSWVGGGAILVTLITVNFQIINAAMTNPVKSLKSE